MSTADEKRLYGDYWSDTFRAMITEYRAQKPTEDLPTESIINTTIFFLRALFMSLDAKEHRYTWKGDLFGAEDDDSPLMITNEWPLAADKLENRPAIVVQLGARAFQNFHLNKQMFKNVPAGTESFHDGIAGSLATKVISRHPYMASRLADWVGINYAILNKYLTFAGFHAISNIQWPPVQPAGNLVNGPSEHDFVQAAAIFQYQWPWNAQMSVIEPVATLDVFDMAIVAYDTPALDEADPEGGIVEPGFTQLLEVKEPGA